MPEVVLLVEGFVPAFCKGGSYTTRYEAVAARGITGLQVKACGLAPEDRNSEEGPYAYVDAVFDPAAWPTVELGLVYGNTQFIDGLRALLRAAGWPDRHLTYTEQGMQGESLVSLEAFDALAEAIARPTAHQRMRNAAWLSENPPASDR